MTSIMMTEEGQRVFDAVDKLEKTSIDLLIKEDGNCDEYDKLCGLSAREFLREFNYSDLSISKYIQYEMKKNIQH